jgi:3-oxoacyl-[acyl-carrier protein] reductase
MFADNAWRYVPGVDPFWPMEIIDEGLANFSPLKRLGLPENVSRVVASSARPESEWINGTSFSNKSSSFRHNSTADSFFLL